MATQLERDFRRLEALEALARDQEGAPEGDAARAKADTIRERYKALFSASGPAYVPEPNPWDQYQAPPRSTQQPKGAQTQRPKPKRPPRRKRSRRDQQVETLGLGLLFGALFIGIAALSELERDWGDEE